MDFKQATDALMECGVTAAEIAAEAGVSVGSILRARMQSGQRRSPPKDWRRILRAVATTQAQRGVADAQARAVTLAYIASELADA